MRKRRLLLLPHTHWDREWYEPFETFRAQLVDVLDNALTALERDSRLHFTLDGQVSLVDDYLELRPANEVRLRALVLAGRVHIGPFYTQAETLVTSGEALIRNLARGIARAQALGGVTRVGYMADQFGHAAQLPQLLSLFGIQHAVLWRGVGPERPPHVFAWRAPDGTSVTTAWLQDGYGSGRRFPSDAPSFVAAVTQTLERHDEWLGSSPALLPIGDDHVHLASWLPDAASALHAAHPTLEIAIGGLTHFFHGLEAPRRVVQGELRSSAFSPVLAGVASARAREKQAMHRATQLLLRYAEPLSAWATLLEGIAPTHLIDRAWHHLALNQAHDSAAGCGSDAMHLDVEARSRWAEQLAIAARDRALAELAVDPPSAGLGVVAFTPSAAAHFVVQTEVPRSLKGPLVATGADGRAWPVQMLESADAPPLFEGEFAAAELGQYLGNIDPATPIFGKYLTGLTARQEVGHVLLDVGMGDAPGAAARLAHDQAHLKSLLAHTERFKIVMHDAMPTTSVLVQGGPAVEAGLMRLAIAPGAPTPGLPTARTLEDGRTGITNGVITVVAQRDGSVLIDDGKRTVRANDLVDERDRGDLYHAEPMGPTVLPTSAVTTVVERGPVRATLRIEQTLEVPTGLTLDRKGAQEARPLRIVTEVSVRAGETRIEFASTFVNAHEDHRLRAQARAHFVADRFDVEHGLAVVARPFEPKKALGAGVERPSTTGPHHLFVDIGAGKDGVALMSRGLIEHEVIRAAGGTTLSLTLLRSVGWLSRGDLAIIDHAAGPMMPTPDAQELGAHRCEYALLLHDGDWRAGNVLAEARDYAAPAIGVHLRGQRVAPSSEALVRVEPAHVVPTAFEPVHHGLRVRVLNASPEPTLARLTLHGGVESAQAVDPLGNAIDVPVALRDGVAEIQLRPWQLATLALS